MRKTKTLGERFAEGHSAGAPDECWLWSGRSTTGRNGYGKIHVGYGYVLAHRAAWELANGSIPGGQIVCHRCDVRLCVNPAHLFLGTVKDNTQDMLAKGRGASRLTAEVVADIRRAVAARRPAIEIARDLGVNVRTVRLAATGKTWSHIPGARREKWGLNPPNPFGGQQTFNGDGSVSQQFTGGLGQAASGLMGQASSYGQPMDWSKFGPVGTGDEARQQAVNASYNQATSRLDPQWDKREEQNRTRLLQQGLDPSSAAARSSAQDLAFQRNDAYGSAMNNAQMMGQQAGDSVFRNNMASQQNAIANALKQRGMPMQEMQQLMGLMGQPQYGQDTSTLQGAMGSAGLAQQQANAQRAEDEARAAREAELAGGGIGLAGSLGAAAMIATSMF